MAEVVGEKIISFEEMSCFVDELMICKDSDVVNTEYMNDEGMFIYTDGRFRVYERTGNPAAIAIDKASFVLRTRVTSVPGGYKTYFTLRTIRDITNSSWKKIMEQIRIIKETYHIDT